MWLIISVQDWSWATLTIEAFSRSRVGPANATGIDEILNDSKGIHKQLNSDHQNNHKKLRAIFIYFV